MKNEEQKKEIKMAMDEILEKKGVNLEKLGQLTDIPGNFLSALYNGDLKKLPPVPYVKGYIDKIGESLEVDVQKIWDIYRDNLKTSGEEDKLPVNRFAFKKIKKGKAILIIVAIIILVVLGFQGGNFIGIPSIEITNPSIDGVVVNTATIDLRGKINSQDKLTINDENISVDKDGYFEKSFSLDPGVITTFEFKVKRLLGKEITITRQVIYKQ